MALTDENGMVMPVSPMYGGMGGNGFGFGGDGAWLEIIVVADTTIWIGTVEQMKRSI